ncbi:hypothetical protein AN639_04410 [Candidatus Epulonipiscium fishelsonii]|nr:hypothetical protein AN639_04410 [Epulopiscium sp. SCG-B05WGA-EpuloA1]
MIVAGKVDKGKKRSNNQDNLFISNLSALALPNLFILLQMVGGLNALGTARANVQLDSFVYMLKLIINYKFLNQRILYFLKRALLLTNYIVYIMASKNI